VGKGGVETDGKRRRWYERTLYIHNREIQNGLRNREKKDKKTRKIPTISKFKNKRKNK
jgi:hypothetical protein